MQIIHCIDATKSLYLACSLHLIILKSAYKKNKHKLKVYSMYNQGCRACNKIYDCSSTPLFQK